MNTELIARAQRGHHEAHILLLEEGLADRLLIVARCILRDDAGREATRVSWLPNVPGTETDFVYWAIP